MTTEKVQPKFKKTRSSKLLVSVFGVFFENKIYGMADKYLKGYTGGGWSFAKSDNGIPFMIPKCEATVEMINPNNHFSDIMKVESAGYALTVMAVSNLMWQHPENKNIIKNFQFMMDNIYNLFSKEEAAKIVSFLN